jgi:xylulose-5-phosphate/fructose-6-phosphate phosphoketolase
MNAYWRAANYLSVGQIYLMDNPLLKQPLAPEHVKPRLLGHWGTSPGLNFIYVHLNRIIKSRSTEVLFVCGPGHGGPAVVANVYLEGTYSEVYPSVSQDELGMRQLFKQFSFPGGIPSHVAAETPGSIHEGGELGYALSHAYGAAFDSPRLCVACVIGDGEAETGALATSWHSNKFLNPVTDGAVLPILHLNGYKIANPTILSRISEEELKCLMIGYGHRPFVVDVESCNEIEAHQRMASTLDQCFDMINDIQTQARLQGLHEEGSNSQISSRPLWPMIIMKSRKGWTGPATVDGKQTEGSWRSHQVPLGDVRNNSEHLKLLEEWLLSYKPAELFTDSGALIPELQNLSPMGSQRMGANAHANCGVGELVLPNFVDYSLEVNVPGSTVSESTKGLARFLRDILKLNQETRNFRVFGPDEITSNRLGDVLDVTNRCFNGTILPTDDHLAVDGRVMEILSEHTCQGWLEGYLLTGRHGFFTCYEAFIHIVDSMFNQHTKWLKNISSKSNICHRWRKPVASLNYFLTSHVWRQDHNGFSHQGIAQQSMLWAEADIVLLMCRSWIR